MGLPKKWEGVSDGYTPVVTKLSDTGVTKEPGDILPELENKGIPAFMDKFDKVFEREFEYPSAEGYPDWQHGYRGGCCFRHAADEAPQGDAFMSLIKF